MPGSWPQRSFFARWIARVVSEVPLTTGRSSFSVRRARIIAHMLIDRSLASSRAAVDAGDATGPSRLAGLEDFVCFTKSQSVSLPSGPSSIRTDSGASGGARSESEEQLSRGGADRSEENVEMSSVGTYQTLPQRRRAIRPNASSAPRTSALKHVSTLSDVTASSVEEVEVDPGIGALERCIWVCRSLTFGLQAYGAIAYTTPTADIVSPCPAASKASSPQNSPFLRRLCRRLSRLGPWLMAGPSQRTLFSRGCIWRELEARDSVWERGGAGQRHSVDV